MPDHTEAIDQFVNAIQQPGWDNPFPVLENLCQALVGHRLFSCSVFEVKDENTSVAARVFTNDEVNYPTSGLKEIVPNRWTGIVIERHETFIANSVDGFADVFPDHELIASLGLGSVVNLPVILRGVFVGTVNMLHAPGHYSEIRLANLHKLILPSILTFRLFHETRANMRDK